MQSETANDLEMKQQFMQIQKQTGVSLNTPRQGVPQDDDLTSGISEEGDIFKLKNQVENQVEKSS